MDKCILPPIHERSTSITAKNAVPIGVGYATMVQIMVDEFKGMCAGSPVKGAAATFALCLDEL